MLKERKKDDNRNRWSLTSNLPSDFLKSRPEESKLKQGAPPLKTIVKTFLCFGFDFFLLVHYISGRWSKQFESGWEVYECGCILSVEGRSFPVWLSEQFLVYMIRMLICCVRWDYWKNRYTGGLRLVHSSGVLSRFMFLIIFLPMGHDMFLFASSFSISICVRNSKTLTV